MFRESLLALIKALLLAVLLPLMAVAAEDYLDPETAFKFSARMVDERTIEVRYVIADGYYMYRERFAFKADGAQLGAPSIPPGKIKFDETFGKDVETHRNSVTIQIPVTADGPFNFTVSSQGCADKGLCYTPMDSTARLSPTAGSGLLSALRGGAQSSASSPAQSGPVLSPVQGGAASGREMGRIEASLQSGQLALIVPLFILLGLGLAFTPCVLPMVPILSSIIVGEGKHVKRARGFALALSYSLGMAVVYTALGVAAGLIGEGLSASLQNPWVLASFALLMVLLSLSMFGFYQLQVPAALQTRLMQVSGKQGGGKLLGVGLMGGISALIVGPCVAAPLAGALVYISQTRDVVTGGSALFAMAIGMSIPLLLVGLSAGALLPRAGPWMDVVKRFFGVLMLATAVWMVTPVIPGWVAMLAWSVLGTVAGVWFLRRNAWAFKIAGLLVFIGGLVQFVGLATGGRDPLAPVAHLTGQAHHLNFQTVRNSAELDKALKQAGGKITMLDFYADWCISCKEMEKLTFTDERVSAELGKMQLLRIDVTANNADDKAMLKRFGLFGPPGMLFFDARGQEMRQARVVGYESPKDFLRSLSLTAGPPRGAL
ncbi:protein-disulfide reductase DsbD [Lacisediminimonas sp.]|uniref:protein-disulfide reductase DsbD n=1 Tax=Lacisediminimonas sp. TaxID=3060582 RepID=UPI002725E5D1|nr:protein-disulfide reductase DsbD [Lacisediminimonas sp.]MDO8299875.1 protein-disulfide reductase DsbD [Lacisediminimonas sp.]